jgi:16S rRNA (adenine1518-N6/adenine1519-N6)-dimethyltransferase
MRKGYSFKKKKSLGQHFLTNDHIAWEIANSLTLHRDYKNVLEIGPGQGVLTRYLTDNPNFQLSLVELDQRCATILEEKYPAMASRIWCENVLRMNFSEHLVAPFGIIGNFPYNISSQILFKLLDNKEAIPELVGMFQKELAKRVIASPGNKDYGILSIFVQAYYDVEYLFEVGPEQFDPPPKVKSAVIRLKRNNVEKLECDDKKFRTVVKAAFNQRRKKLRNALGSLMEKELMEGKEIFDLRAEQLSIAEFVDLTNLIFD